MSKVFENYQRTRCAILLTPCDLSRGEKQDNTKSRAERGTAYSLCRHFGRRFGEFALPQANKSPTVMKMSPIRAGTANTVLYQLDKIICFLENNFDVLFFETLLKTTIFSFISNISIKFYNFIVNS
ncbi:hypothetical protein [Petrimonas sp.]|uniref:hypothetical protein n=1 Tax=Petrimonas sp. TaxID=2023866 RepID=UPI003F51A5A3